jgi:hypothetical protein
VFATDIYGTSPTFIGAVPPGTALSATDDSGQQGWRALVDPRNPLVWVGAVLLITVGAASAAGSARLGPARIAGAIGK